MDCFCFCGSERIIKISADPKCQNVGPYVTAKQQAFQTESAQLFVHVEECRLGMVSRRPVGRTEIKHPRESPNSL